MIYKINTENQSLLHKLSNTTSTTLRNDFTTDTTRKYTKNKLISAQLCFFFVFFHDTFQSSTEKNKTVWRQNTTTYEPKKRVYFSKRANIMPIGFSEHTYKWVKEIPTRNYIHISATLRRRMKNSCFSRSFKIFLFYSSGFTLN